MRISRINQVFLTVCLCFAACFFPTVSLWAADAKPADTPVKESPYSAILSLNPIPSFISLGNTPSGASSSAHVYLQGSFEIKNSSSSSVVMTLTSDSTVANNYSGSLAFRFYAQKTAPEGFYLGVVMGGAAYPDGDINSSFFGGISAGYQWVIYNGTVSLDPGLDVISASRMSGSLMPELSGPNTQTGGAEILWRLSVGFPFTLPK